MKKLGSVLIIVLLFSCTARKSKPVNETISGQTEIYFEETSHDFGTLTAGEIVVVDFVFENRGSNFLKIEKAESDCGCVNAKIPDAPIKPGDKGRIEVQFDTSGLFGNNLKSIEIYSNSKEPKHLVIFAEVKNDKIEIKY